MEVYFTKTFIVHILHMGKVQANIHMQSHVVTQAHMEALTQAHTKNYS